jgi:hypothetical protein
MRAQKEASWINHFPSRYAHELSSHPGIVFVRMLMVTAFDGMERFGLVDMYYRGRKTVKQKVLSGKYQTLSFSLSVGLLFVTTCDCSFKNSPLIVEQAVNLESLLFINDTQYF